MLQEKYVLLHFLASNQQDQESRAKELANIKIEDARLPESVQVFSGVEAAPKK